MKKILNFAIAVFAVAFLAGCGSTKGTLYGAEQNEKNGLPRWARQDVVFLTSEADAYGAIILSQKGAYATGMSQGLGNQKITAQAANLSARTALAGYIAQSLADLQHYDNDLEKTDFKQKTQANIANVLTGVRIVDGIEDERNGNYFSLAFISDKDLKASLDKVDSVELRTISADLLKKWNEEWNPEPEKAQ